VRNSLSEIKIYRVTGYMLISTRGLNEWRKFVKEVRALNPKHAIETVYSEIGGNHKIKRRNIKIVEISEIPLEEVRSRYIRSLTLVTRLS